MGVKTEVRFNMKGLDKFRQDAEGYRARVGILGAKDARPGDPLSNAEIGVVQIFGSISRNIPPRDFLLMPIEVNKKELLRQMRQGSVKKAIAQGDVIKVFKLLGAAAEAFVQQAFQTKGFGHWAPNAPSTIDAKGSNSPLIDTAQLRRSITSDVKRKGEI